MDIISNQQHITASRLNHPAAAGNHQTVGTTVYEKGKQSRTDRNRGKITRFPPLLAPKQVIRLYRTIIHTLLVLV